MEKSEPTLERAANGAGERDASLALGRRFLRLATGLLPAIEPFCGHLEAADTESHHVTSFGLVTALAGIGESSAVLAWLHQSSTALVSAAQRLAPLGSLAPAGFFGR